MEKIEYKNKVIEFEESPNPKISIDGRSIQISRDEEAREFNTCELPYRSFKSVKQLAEEIVDQ